MVYRHVANHRLIRKIQTTLMTLNNSPTDSAHCAAASDQGMVRRPRPDIILCIQVSPAGGGCSTLPSSRPAPEHGKNEDNVYQHLLAMGCGHIYMGGEKCKLWRARIETSQRKYTIRAHRYTPMILRLGHTYFEQIKTNCRPGHSWREASPLPGATATDP